MANPRKFSEKIALHTHRQAEETARFEQIMKEVSDATARPEDGMPHSPQHMGGGGHVTNANAGAAAAAAAAASTSSSSSSPSHHHRQHHNHHYRDSRPRSTAGPIRRPQDRKHDTSPYSSGSFLSPPPDTSWRRTHSDSALHQSAMQGLSNERNDASGNGRYFGQESHDGRPRSSCEVPRVPGINIYHSAPEPGMIQIPIGKNTGSLPDLTSMHFPSPIHAPLDQDPDQGSSPYSSSPVNTSPATLSPTNVMAGVNRPQGSFQFGQIQSNQNHLSVPFNTKYLHHNKNTKLDNSMTSLDGPEFIQIGAVSGNIYQQQCPPASPSPTLQLVGTNNYRSPRPSPQSSPSLGGRHSAPCSPSAPSPLPQQQPSSSSTTNDYQIFNQAAQLQQHFEQFSMMDGPPNNVSYVDHHQHHHQQQQQQQHQQQQQQQQHNTASGSGNQNMTPQNNHHHHHLHHHQQQQQQHQQQQQQQHQQQTMSTSDMSGVGTIELTSDAGYYSTSPSQLVYPTAPPSLHTTPNTPTSIPDIILTDFTDFTTEPHDIARQDLTLSKPFEVDLLASETLRQDLEPLDFDGLQMLSDSGINLIADGVEDNFRLDRS